MIGPTEYDALITAKYINKLTPKIDEKIKNYDTETHHPWIHILIENEFSKNIRDEIAKLYKEAGWYKVYHQTSSENKEAPGLTSFVFTTAETNEHFVNAFATSINKWHCV